MNTCTRCNKTVGFFGSLLAFNKKTKRCGECENKIRQILTNFRQSFINLSQQGSFTDSKFRWLYQEVQKENVDWDEALNFIRGDALHFLERSLTFAAADGIITEEESKYIYQVQQQLGIPANLAKPLLDRLEYLKRISNIRQGNLPIIPASIHLETDEKCHLEIVAAYQKVNTKSITIINGRLVATNKKLHFLSPKGGWTIQWNNIMRVERDSRSIYLELSTKKGNGCYLVIDPLLAEATIDTLVRLAKRQLLAPQKNGSSRHIPHDIKTAVYQRDQGKCVQCSDTSYMEFDHIIPFSKGGANTLNNVQLLCRRCNLAKGDRI